MSIIRTMGMLGLLLAIIGLAKLGGYIGLFLSGSLGFVFIYILVISLWIGRGNIHAVRKIHQLRPEAGNPVEVSITINLPMRYWLCWVVVEERWIQQKNDLLQDGKQEKIGKHSKRDIHAKQDVEAEQYACLAYIRGERNIKCHYMTSVKARGLYRVHSSRVMIGDMFGLVKRVLIQDEQEADIVQVNPIPLLGNWYKPMQQSGGAPADYGTLRDYISGDPISSIDWKSYARYQTLKTKQLELEERNSLLIVMDARKPQFESIVSAVTRMLLEMNDPTLEIILACGHSRCLVTPQQGNQSGISTDVYHWLSRIEASSVDSFAEQLRYAMARPGANIHTYENSQSHTNSRIINAHINSNCSIIGITMSSEESIPKVNHSFNQQQSIHIVYIPYTAEGNRGGELSYA